MTIEANRGLPKYPEFGFGEDIHIFANQKMYDPNAPSIISPTVRLRELGLVRAELRVRNLYEASILLAPHSDSGVDRVVSVLAFETEMQDPDIACQLFTPQGSLISFAYEQERQRRALFNRWIKPGQTRAEGMWYSLPHDPDLIRESFIRFGNGLRRR